MPGNNPFLSPDLVQADELFTNQRYSEAITLYRKLLERPGENKLSILEKLGWSCYLDGQYKEAFRYFQWYDKLSPNELTIQTMMGICAFEMNDFKTAKEILLSTIHDSLAPEEALATLIKTLIRLQEPFESYIQKWWEHATITPSLTYDIANELISMNIPMAEAFLEMALSRFPSDTSLLYGMAICQLKKQDYHKAALFCEDILSHEREKFPLATLIVAISKILAKDTQKAISLIEEANQKGWLDSEWHRQLAAAWKNIQNIKKTREHLWQAIRLQPEDSSLWLSYLDALSSTGEANEFLFACEEAYNHTKDPVFLKIAGSFAFSIGKYPEASQLLQKAYTLFQDKETLTLLIMALFSTGEETIETIASLASSLSPSPDFHPYAAYCIGKTYLSMGERDKAYLWFSNTLSSFPDDPNLLYGLALVEMDRHQWQKAQEILLRALTMADHPTLSYALGLCYLQTKEIAKASSLFLSLCETKKDANFCYEIALLFLKNHYKQEALPFLTQAVTYDPNHQEAMAYLRLLKNHKES